MKIKHIFVIMMVLFLIGCAQEHAEHEDMPEEIVKEQPIEKEEIAPEPELIVEEAEPQAPAAVDVTLSSSGFDPSEITISAPGKVMISITGKKHVISKVGGGFRSEGLFEGDTTEIAIDEAGTVEYFDIISKRKLKVIAEAGSAMPEGS